jgi:hypothetical protein
MGFKEDGMKKVWMIICVGCLAAALLLGCSLRSERAPDLIAPTPSLQSTGPALVTPSPDITSTVSASATPAPQSTATTAPTLAPTTTMTSAPSQTATVTPRASATATPTLQDAWSAVDPRLKNMLTRARADLSRRTGVPVADIQLLDVTLVMWPNKGGGCPTPGIVYAQVSQDGVLIHFQAHGLAYSYVVNDSTGAQITSDASYCESPAATSPRN